MSILQLPVELLHWCFDYLDTETIFNSIRPVCIEFHQAVQTYNKFRLDLSSFSNADIRFLANFIQPINVITLTLVNNAEIGLSRTNLFFSLFQLDQFTRLQSLTLLRISGTHLKQCFQYMMADPLLSLSITLCRQWTIETRKIMDLLSVATAQCALQNLYLNIFNVIFTIDDLSAPLQRVLQSLTIDTCTYHEYHLILHGCPLLRTFVLDDCTQQYISMPQFPSFTAANRPKLTSLTLNNCSLMIDTLHRLLSLTPRLDHLKVISRPISDLPIFNGYLWESFIQTKLPSLEKFEFRFIYKFSKYLSKPLLESIIKPYTTPFWLHNKHWIVTCDHVLTTLKIILHTIPVYANDPGVIVRCSSLSADNCYNILTSSYSGPLYTEEALTTFNLSKFRLTDETVEYLANALKTNKTLTTLKFEQNEMTVDGIRHIADALKYNTGLLTLHVENNNVNGYAAQCLLNSLKNNKTLTTINLPYNRIGTHEAKYIEDMLQENTTLIHLNIKNNQIGDQGVQFILNALKKNTTLKILNLEQNRIGIQGAKCLAEKLKNNTGLNTLDLQSNTIGDLGMEYLAYALAHNTTLNILNLAYNQIGLLGIQYLKDALRNNKSLTTLNLEVNSIDSSGAEHLADAIRSNTTLTTLILGINQIGPVGAKYLADTLETNTVLTTIDLRTNGIGPLGTKSLVDALRKNTTLTTLYLRGNNIGLTGSEYLADMLRHNRTLVTLFLENNQIGDDGLEHLANALQNNTVLKTLNLTQNNIRISEATYITNLLENNTTLATLILTKNEITTTGAKYIADALGNNMTIITVDIQQNNSIDENILNMIDEILKRNKKIQEENMDCS